MLEAISGIPGAESWSTVEPELKASRVTGSSTLRIRPVRRLLLRLSDKGVWAVMR
ncbi:hypothetical protein [Paenibacillus sp. 22594]|uniref:hypothetical protein n=1 Tax=Paenibacillus sp. 22594 TaxID=3453947 RepID=UPI003F857FBF